MQYLFNSLGDWIAFRDGEHVYDVSGDWIGWVAWHDSENRPEVADGEGRYLGTIFPGDRLYRQLDADDREAAMYPVYPGSHDHTGYPSFPEATPLPAGAEDIQELQAA